MFMNLFYGPENKDTLAKAVPSLLLEDLTPGLCLPGSDTPTLISPPEHGLPLQLLME